MRPAPTPSLRLGFLCLSLSLSLAARTGVSRGAAIAIGGYASGVGLWAARVARAESAYSDAKRELFGRYLRPDDAVLEVGIGLEGATLDYYPKGCRVTGLEPRLRDDNAAAMRRRATARDLRLELTRGCGEDLPFPPGSFDAVVTSLVLCSAKDPKAVVEEAHRVLRRGGRFVFVEHIHALEDAAFMRWQQATLDPLQQRLADGCHLQRENDALFKDAAERGLFRIEELRYVDVPSRWPCNVQMMGCMAKA